MKTSKLTGGILFDTYNLAKNYFINEIDVSIHKNAYKGEHDQWFAESEFAGKYLDTCINFYTNCGDEKALCNAKKVVGSIIENQRDDGYIGGLEKGMEWEKFSVWNQAFTIYGLISYYKVTNDSDALKVAEKSMTYIANHFMYEGGDINDAWNFGSQHLSILIAVPELYKITKNNLYFDFMQHIKDKMINSENNFYNCVDILKLYSKKAIENLVILCGMMLYGEVQNDKTAFTACENYRNQLEKTQIRETGNGSSAELWRENGNQPAFRSTDEKPNENCVAVGWTELNALLFKYNQKSYYIDSIEKTLFNHLLGAMGRKGEDFAYYQPNYGKKCRSTEIGMYKCCRYRGYSIVSRFEELLFYRSENTLIPIIYSESEYKDEDIYVKETTAYPFSDIVKFEIKTKKEVLFKLRIPDWCEKNTVLINKEETNFKKTDGYINIKVNNDCVIELCLNTVPTIKKVSIENKNYISVTYGSVLLALDSRFVDNPLKAHIDSDNPEFERVLQSDNNLEFLCNGFYEDKKIRLHLTDYATCGTVTENGNEYTVWIAEKPDNNK